MKKKGFTLVELLAVIAILAVLVIIALPNVLRMFRNAKQNTFTNEVQNLMRSAEDKYLTSSMLNGNNTCFDSKTNPLDMSGRDNINYLIKLTNKGKVIEVKVMDDSYQLLIDNQNGIDKADIGNKYKIETRNKTTDIFDCNNSFLVQGENGTGDESTPYKIQYIEDLVELSKNVEAGETYAGKTFVLSRNLDFKNKDSYKEKENSELYTKLTTDTGFTPIGTESIPFSGTFDGQNHRIDNLYVNKTIENLGATAFIGFLKNGNVKNLTIQGSVETNAINNSLGGIVGRIDNSTIDNCINEVIVTNKTNTYATGGVAGWSSGDATIKNSTNKSNITGGGYTGGIIAGSQGGTLTIENCKNYGTITNEAGNSSAGIVAESGVYGEVKKTIIKNSTNYGEIKGKNYLGGIIGRTAKELEIENCNNEGKITINSNDVFFAGGIVGYVSDKVNINNSHNKNTITSNKTDNIGNRIIGGLVGDIDSTQTSIITNSSNEKTGVISGGNRTGGLVGYCDAGLIMHNSYNLANISSSDAWSSSIHIGGLLGSSSGWSKKHEDIVILNSYNKGNINVSIDNYSSNAGGLVGYQISSNSTNTTDTSPNTKIINSYNQGNITMNGTTTGILNANGIIQINPKSVTLNNVYNIGTLNSIKTNNVITNNNSNVTTNYKNVYYLNSLSGEKPSDTTNVLGKSESEMKNATFVNTLNINKNSIDLSSIDSRLSGYTLCDWKLGNSGYPELDCK